MLAELPTLVKSDGFVNIAKPVMEYADGRLHGTNLLPVIPIPRRDHVPLHLLVLPILSKFPKFPGNDAGAEMQADAVGNEKPPTL